jgi:hypothetical protein
VRSTNRKWAFSNSNPDSLVKVEPDFGTHTLEFLEVIVEEVIGIILFARVLGFLVECLEKIGCALGC